MAERTGLAPAYPFSRLLSKKFQYYYGTFPKIGAPSGSRNRIYSFGPRIKT